MSEFIVTLPEQTNDALELLLILNKLILNKNDGERDSPKYIARLSLTNRLKELCTTDGTDIYKHAHNIISYLVNSFSLNVCDFEHIDQNDMYFIATCGNNNKEYCVYIDGDNLGTLEDFTEVFWGPFGVIFIKCKKCGKIVCDILHTPHPGCSKCGWYTL